MNIAVIIKCSDDPRIFRCISSIPSYVEVVCSITPNPTIEKKLAEMGIPYCITPKGNLSVTTNTGIHLAKASNIIIMDSDSYFDKDAVGLLYRSLKKHLIVKGQIIFSKNRTLSSCLVAKLRKYMNRGLVAYVPGLAFRKEIKNYINGYFFNPKVCWAEDAELTYRINEAGIKLKIVDEAKIYHDPVSLTHDLQAAFRIGCGKRMIVKITEKYNKEDISQVFLSILNGKFIKEWISILRNEGLLVFIYYFLWQFFYYLGYYFTRIKLKIHS